MVGLFFVLLVEVFYVSEKIFCQRLDAGVPAPRPAPVAGG
jgi:hypothetical protein